MKFSNPMFVCLFFAFGSWAALKTAVLHADEVELRNGSVFEGVVLSEDARLVVLRVSWGTLEFKKEEVVELRRKALRIRKPPVAELRPALSGERAELRQNEPLQGMTGGAATKQGAAGEGKEALASSPGSQGEPSLSSAGVAKLPPEILGQLQRGDSASREETVAALVGLGPEVLDSFLEIVRERARGTEGPRVSVEIVGAVLRAFLQEGAEDRISPILEAASAEELAYWFDAVVTLGGKEGASLAYSFLDASNNSLAEEACRAMSRMVEKRPEDVLPAIDEWYRDEAAADKRAKILRALAGARRPEATPLLVAGLGDSSDIVRLQAVQAVPVVGYLGGDWPGRLAELLGDSNPLVRRQAALVTGQLKNYDSVPILIGQLESADRGLAENVLWALRAISGQNFPANVSRWTAWWESEGKQFGKDIHVLMGRLASASQEETISALQSLGSYRGADKDRVADAILPLLGDARERVRIVALETIRQLGSLRPVEPLIDMMGRATGSFAEQVHAALVQLTGQQHPPDRAAWRRWWTEQAPR